MPDHDLTIDDPLAAALRVFEAERQAGSTPDADEFCRRYPDLGSELRDVLAAAALLDRARQSDPSRTGGFVSRESDSPTARSASTGSFARSAPAGWASFMRRCRNR